MAKFILHGGMASKPVISNKRFFREIVKTLKEPVKILVVCFAKEKDEWQETYKRDKSSFSSALPDKKLEFFLAKENTKKFINQIMSSDVIYLRGGSNSLLKKSLEKIGNLQKLFKNKVVVGSSAGANVLAKYYYSNDANVLEKGLGILPIKVFCHFKKEEVKKLKKSKEYGENLKVYPLPETEYIVLKEE